nr:DUF2515 family protein [Bacillus sp. FJAT-29790]
MEIRADLKNRIKEHKTAFPLNEEDERLLRKIRGLTAEHNLNNVTRTKAYLNFYRKYPEVHWAFLGHMVSRNGGWNMTDLKGELLSKLLDERTKKDFFGFLERGNWLIFQDAYPQFLVYDESIKREQNLFHLLPHLNISIFMQSVWNYFWHHRDKTTLTIALVINEQSYLEKQVIQNAFFKDKVLDTLEFMLQDILSLNHILFPFVDEKGENIAIIGQTLNHFNSLHERILLGKRLYRILFGDKIQLEKTLIWAFSHPHTGSRKDYWPHIFNDLKEALPGFGFTKRLKNCQLRKGAVRLYSPRLELAWRNVDHLPAQPVEWFDSLDTINCLRELDENIDGEISDEYCETLDKLELAAIAKKAIFI